MASHADAPYPPQVLQNGQVGSPNGVVGELDDARAREIVSLGAGFEPSLGDAAEVDVAGSAWLRKLSDHLFFVRQGFLSDQLCQNLKLGVFVHQDGPLLDGKGGNESICQGEAVAGFEAGGRKQSGLVYAP